MARFILFLEVSIGTRYRYSDSPTRSRRWWYGTIRAISPRMSFAIPLEGPRYSPGVVKPFYCLLAPGFLMPQLPLCNLRRRTSGVDLRRIRVQLMVRSGD